MTLEVWIVTAAEIVAVAALAAALILLLARGRRIEGLPRFLLILLVGLSLTVAVSNAVEWTGALPWADLAEAFLWPPVAILWLFVFVVGTERADRADLRRSYDRLLAVHDLAVRLASTLESRTVMENVVRSAARLLDGQRAAILTPDADGAAMNIAAFVGMTEEQARAVRLARGEGLSWEAFLSLQTVRRDRATIPIPIRAAEEPCPPEAAVCVPLVAGDSALGVLIVSRSADAPFTDPDVSLLETLASQAAVAIRNARLYERLAESEARYRTLVENAQVAIATTDAGLRITFWNRGCERLSGWTADEALGRDVNFIVPPDRRDSLSAEILTPLMRDGAWFGEHPVLRKDGSRFTAFLSLSRILDAQGKAVCLLGIVMDVTEHVRLREQFLQAQKMETLGRLAGGVAHDFNNLLTGILGFAGLLRSEIKPGTEAYESLRQIEDAARRGTDLVRQLMSVSHDKPQRTEPVRLNDVIVQALPLIERASGIRVRVVTHLAPDLRTIRADATQIHQVLMNLAINAADAMPDGGELTIATENFECALAKTGPSPLPAGPCVRLTFADTGRGIAPDVFPHIFEPFFTTKADRGGTGLGLSTVYAIAKRHGGCALCTSQPGQGATFHVVLPATAP